MSDKKGNLVSEALGLVGIAAHARSSGPCILCKGLISRGEVGVWVQGEGFFHTDCFAKGKEDSPSPAPKKDLLTISLSFTVDVEKLREADVDPTTSEGKAKLKQLLLEGAELHRDPLLDAFLEEF